MELVLQSSAGSARGSSFWKNPIAWLKEKNLSRGYWIFFFAAFFFDAGFAIYFFLFNLYLLDCRFNERAMGWIGGAFTLGSLVGTLPAGVLTQKFGVRPLLIFLFVSAPLMNAVRAVWLWEPGQIGVAFLAGLAMSVWGVCFLPAVARLTTEGNRTSGFSFIFSVSVGTSMLGGIVCGYLRQWLAMVGIALQPAETKRLILLLSCGIAFLGLIPVLRLHLPLRSEQNSGETSPAHWNWLSKWKIGPFLRRYLPLMALWSAVLAAFNPFANVYLTRNLHVPMAQIGLIFSTVQVLQFFMGILTPIVFRAVGLMNGIVLTQIAAAVVLGCLAGSTNQKLTVVLYLVYSAAQWMSAPGLYNLVMNETPDSERSAASAMTMFCNALMASLATAAAGVLLTRFGYAPVLLGLALAALAIALVFRFNVAPLTQEYSRASQAPALKD
jgi:MFS family permease